MLKPHRRDPQSLLSPQSQTLPTSRNAMRRPLGAAKPMSLLPIIDLARFDHGNPAERADIAAAVDAACRDIGFLLIRGHGVPAASIARMHDVSADFFSQPMAHKRR